MTQHITGQVVSVDAAGNLVTDITANQLENAPQDERISFRCDEHETSGIFNKDHGQPELTFIAIMGDSGQVQLTIVGESAHLMLGIPVGEKVFVAWT